MIVSRLRGGVAGVALVLAATTAIDAATAQTAAVPAVGNFGGGAIGLPISASTVSKDMELSIRAPKRGRISVHGQMFASCGQATISGRTSLRSNGGFTLRGSVTRTPASGVRARSTFTVRGTLTAAGGEGTARVKLRVRRKGSKTRSCTTRTLTWTVRRPGPVAAAPAPAPAATTLYGVTTQRTSSKARRALVVRTGRDGTTIERVALAFRSKCERRRIVVTDDTDVSGEFDVKPDGSFRSVDRFRINFSDVVLRATVVFKGQFDATGAARGKLAVTERYTDRRTGRRFDVCKTGTQSWSARP